MELEKVENIKNSSEITSKSASAKALEVARVPVDKLIKFYKQYKPLIDPIVKVAVYWIGEQLKKLTRRKTSSNTNKNHK